MMFEICGIIISGNHATIFSVCKPFVGSDNDYSERIRGCTESDKLLFDDYMSACEFIESHKMCGKWYAVFHYSN